jgi:protein disulfide-isomerase
VQLASGGKLPDTREVKIFRLSLLVAALLALVAVAPISAAKPGWLTNYKDAQEQAKTGKKLLLLDFTGSDWCGWCIKLDREVFSKSEFKQYAEKNLVLLEVDFPRGKALSDEERAQNEQLAVRYQIQGFPTIIVLDGEGKKVGELSYMPGGAATFIAELDKLRKS